ncbi:MAG: hypothetical protein LR008_03510 [Candidatus Pacebacteria bacterium]|nr:hypothetical protein [Candidatus Paceibacterota bacterium]
MKEYSTPKKMKRVGDLFAKYHTRFKAPQATVEKACVEVVKDVTGFDIEKSQVVYKVGTKTLSLQIPSILKSEMKLSFPLILKKLEERLGENKSPKTIL